MDFINCVLIALICVGFGFIIFSLFKKENNENDSEVNIDSINKLINNSLTTVDDAIEQLNALSSNVFEEFEEKYQQLLFLYQLIDEKKEEALKLNNREPKEVPSKKIKGFNYNNPHLKEIQKLQKQGLSIAEISKKLDIGQGEVKLIIELGKKG